MKEKLSRFAPTAGIGLIGLLILIYGISTGQDSLFVLGGVFLLSVAVIALLNALEIIQNKIAVILSGILAAICLVLVYFNYQSINGPIQYIKEKERRYAYVIQGLKDIREAQILYKKKNGIYTSSFDTLINFIKYDSIAVVKKTGIVPDTLTEIQALERGVITRDTTIVPVYHEIFTETYLGSRFAKHPLNIDSLSYIPFTNGAQFEMQTTMIERSGGIQVPAFQVVDSKPFDSKEVMQVGSLVDPTTSGNWKDER